MDRLTDRQREWFLLYLEGLDSKEIAYRMCVPPSRVTRLKHAVMDAFRRSTQIELIAYAQQLGLLDGDGHTSDQHKKAKAEVLMMRLTLLQPPLTQPRLQRERSRKVIGKRMRFDV